MGQAETYKVRSGLQRAFTKIEKTAARYNYLGCILMADNPMPRNDLHFNSATLFDALLGNTLILTRAQAQS